MSPTSDENDQKKRWKTESDQLKSDLKNRPKSVEKRPLSIQFGGKKKKPAESKTPPPPASTPDQDRLLRQQLGL